MDGNRCRRSYGFNYIWNVKKIKEAQNITQEKITEAVNAYLDENPVAARATLDENGVLYFLMKGDE